MTAAMSLKTRSPHGYLAAAARGLCPATNEIPSTRSTNPVDPGHFQEAPGS